MRLYIENNQSVICNKANRPKFNDREDWQHETALVDRKEIVFYYSYRFQNQAKKESLMKKYKKRGLIDNILYRRWHFI